METVFFRRRCFTLRFNVLLDDLIGHVARACCEIAACPQVPSPKLSAQLTKLLQHPSAATPLDSLHQLAHRYLWRHRYQQMHVVRSDMPAQDVYVQRGARLPNQFAQATRYLPAQHRLAILGDLHQVVFQIVNCVRCLAVTHTAIVLQRQLSSTEMPLWC
jgi:hypothetical protein